MEVLAESLGVPSGTPTGTLLTLTTEEANLVEKLTLKYSGGGSSVTRDHPAPQAPTATTTVPQTTSSCRMCGACHGSGTTVESYGHRRIERCCGACSGEGVQPVGSHGAAGAAAGAGHAPARPAGSRKNSWSSAAERLAGYEQELVELKASLAKCTDEQELRLRADLIMHLEREAARLRTQQ